MARGTQAMEASHLEKANARGGKLLLGDISRKWVRVT